MAAPAFDPNLLQRHGPLVQRIAAIAGFILDDGATALCDAADPAPAGARRQQVALGRSGGAPSLRRMGPGRYRIGYADPCAEGSLAMALAALSGPDLPIAADAESLSVVALAERLAASDIPVLINGPTGTGKEVLSRFIHARSPRRDGPFVAVNCAAMPESMLEAMLFGHQKGAFTGATAASEGFMRAADGGTLLLDEIAEMPLALQAKLLRALQEQEVVPIGSTKPIKIDVRVIACANRDLPAEVAEGRFRADLYYRLNVFPLTLCPLRERPDDIAPLAYGMVMRHAVQNPAQPCDLPVIGDGAMALLKLHAWPGNVRELENVVRRALLLAGSETVISPAHIVFDSPARLVGSEARSAASAPLAAPAEAVHDITGVGGEGEGRTLSSIVQNSEARAIVETLETCGGNRARAARELGISERTLRYRLASMRQAGIELGRGAAAGGRR